MPRPHLVRILLIVLVVFLLPPLVLDFLARRLLEEEERQVTAQQEQSLLATLRAAQAELAPERRLAVALERVAERLGWGPGEQGRPRRPAAGHPDAGSPRAVLERLRPLLRRQIPAPPLAVWVVGANARSGASYGDPRFYQGPAPFGETAVRTLMAGWLGLLDRRPWGAAPELEDFRRRWAGQAGRRAFREHRGKVGTHLFGEFLPLEIDLGAPDSFFCSRFGTGRIWVAGGALTDGAGPDAPLLGAFAVFYRDADLPRSFLLAGARGPRRRLVTLAGNGIPRFTRTAGRLALAAPLPFEFQPAIRRGAMTPGRDGPVRMLQVWLPSDDRTHPFRRRLAQAELGLGLWAIAGSLVFWGMAVGRLALPLPIRGQLALALAAAVLPPALACGLFAHSFLGFWRAEGERAAREILGQSLQMLESGMAGHVNGEQEKVWLAKERLATLLQSSPERLSQELDRLLSSSQGQLAHLVRADGAEWFRSAVFPGLAPIPPETSDKMVSLARVLAVRLFQAYNPATWKTDRDRGNPAFWSKEQLAVAAQIWKPEEFAVYLARDPLPLDARSTGFRDGLATGFLLWEPTRPEVVPTTMSPPPTARDPRSPPAREAPPPPARKLAGILFLSRQNGAIGRPYFSARLAKDWSRDRQHPDLSVQTAVFPCTRGGHEGSWRLQTTPCWPPTAAQDHRLVRIARQACGNPWSVQPPLPDGRLVATRVFQSFPFVAVAVGRMAQGAV
ncbi:MAG: hypothetical protein GX442_26400, partial [Candidatus Riflebacteria bacterium]|nr:hypothetical protein [Candidatus Riflebacteria bacterium]